MNFLRVTVSASGLAGVLACLSGCPSPNSYGTPRTIESGKVAHTVALEALGFTYKTPVVATNGTVTTESKTIFLPTFPTYQLRVGVADNVDLGFRLSNLSSIGADGKFNFIRSKSFDLAFDPGFQWMYLPSFGDATASINLFYFHLPLLVGINFSKAVSLVVTPGGLFALATASYNSNGYQSAYTAGGFVGRLGVGLNIRFSKGFAIQPEFTAMHSFKSEGTVFSAGLGFNFGTLPSFDDVGSPDEEETAPAGAKPAAAPKSAN